MSGHHQPTKTTMPERITADRIVLRPYAHGDEDLLVAASVRNLDHLARFESRNFICGVKSTADAARLIDSLREEWEGDAAYVFGIFDRATGSWAGQLYLAPTNREIPEYTVGYVADVSFEGRGYVSEAVRTIVQTLFDVHGAYRVAGDCSEDNERSARVFERCGFTLEGHLRNNRRYPDGRLHGDLLYGLLRDDPPAATGIPASVG